MKSLLWLIESMQTENLKRAFSDTKAMRFIVIFYVFYCLFQRTSYPFSMLFYLRNIRNLCNISNLFRVFKFL